MLTVRNGTTVSDSKRNISFPLHEQLDITSR